MREWDNNHHNAHTLLTQNPLPAGSIYSHYNSSHGPNLCDRRLAFIGCSQQILSHHLYWLIDSNITFNTIFINVEVLTHRGSLIKGRCSFTALHNGNRKALFFAQSREDGGSTEIGNIWMNFPVSHTQHLFILLIYWVFCSGCITVWFCIRAYVRLPKNILRSIYTSSKLSFLAHISIFHDTKG